MVKRMIMVLVAALAIGACGGGGGPTTTWVPGEVEAGDPVNGARVYTGVCSACHSRDLSGVEGLGKALAPSDYIVETSDEELLELLVIGRDIDHPDNDTGIAMPPRGGNPALTDQDLADVVAYMKAQNGL